MAIYSSKCSKIHIISEKMANYLNLWVPPKDNFDILNVFPYVMTKYYEQTLAMAISVILQAINEWILSKNMFILHKYLTLRPFFLKSRRLIIWFFGLNLLRNTSGSFYLKEIKIGSHSQAVPKNILIFLKIVDFAWTHKFLILWEILEN